ncbi:interleukin-8-like [Kryptolebias marmoratus]|uniref:Interleukin-8-like n=1 Tax=Kryptolebias marmoratus TaxID=37003 RepID=A0A3Q2ZXB8_KRYMA|nr:interleukin-8-like [Kryptolebias marmoratus]XP_024865462.1 interleukin-8-like [Kryptolebias marmoratus]XP_037831368.1 interleukin-8-like [Kryptolebias marmoratus]XP_037831371.1 interleukin-8-like [Kryptolebias marmoratus]
MKSAVFAFLACTLVLSAQGQLASRSSKCKCSNGFLTRINPSMFKGEPVVYQPSVFCSRTEIILKTKDNKEKCLDPESRLGKRILEVRQKHRKAGAVRMTTASAQTSTSDSTRRHTTFKM